MDKDMVNQVMDAVMKRLGDTPAPAAPGAEKASGGVEPCFANIGVTEFVGTAQGRSIGIISDRVGAGPQIMATDEAVKATNTEVLSIELPRDTEGGAGHGCLILLGAEDVSDARRAVEVALSNVQNYFGDVWGNEVGYLELQYTARASYAVNKGLGGPLGKAYGLVLGAPAGIGVVICDTAVKAAEVEVLSYASPSKTSYTNEAFISITGDSGAVRQAIRAARDVGLKLLGAMGSEPKSASVSYI